MGHLRLWAFLLALVITLATIPRAHRLGSADFRVFYTAAQYLGEDPKLLYREGPDRYLYPPSTAFLLKPFAWSSYYPWSQWVWHGFLGLVLFSLAGVNWGAWLALLFLTRHLAISFGYGQINLVVMALMAWAGSLRKSGPLGAGILWALASSIKVYPLAMAPLFLGRSYWRAWVGAVLGGGLVLSLPYLFLGSEMAWFLYGEFPQALAAKGLPNHSHNQSLTGLFLRLFTDQPFVLHGVGEIKWAYLSLSPHSVQQGALASGIFLTAFTWFWAWRRGKDLLSATAFSILFLSHIVWKDYLLLLYFPLRELWERPSKARYLLGGPLAFLFFGSSPEIWGAPLAARFDAASGHLWAAVLVWIYWCYKK